MRHSELVDSPHRSALNHSGLGLICHTDLVIWFFQRAGAEMQVVTRFDQSSGDYIVEVAWPDRDKTIERYAEYEAFNRRVQRLHTELLESRWLQNGTPALISDGWRGPSSSS
jgi:hypothetical protein